MKQLSSDTELKKAIRSIYLAFAGLNLIMFIASVGYWIAGWSFMDSIYMVIITVFGVGFGEVHPLDTPGLKIMTIIVILSGTTCAVYLVSSIIRVFTEGEIRLAIRNRVRNKAITTMNQHTIICGFGRLGQILAQELNQDGSPFIILDKSDDRIQMAMNKGYTYLHGDAQDEDCLLKAGIQRANHLATVLPNDTINVFITLTARNLNSELKIIARGEDPQTEKKLLQAGANEVVFPAAIGGIRLAHMILKPTLNRLVSREDESNQMGYDLKQLGIEMHQLTIPENSRWVGKTLKQLLDKVEPHTMVLTIEKSNGELIERPKSEFILDVDDKLVILGHQKAIFSLAQ